MKKRLLGVVLLAVGSAGMAWLLPVPAAAQAAAKAAPAAAKGKYKAPRADDGKTANLQGVWIVDGWDTSRYSLEWHNGATGIRPGRGAITDPADGLIPYKPEARKKQQENFKSRFEIGRAHV